MTTTRKPKPDLIALAKIHLAKYAWAGELITSAEAGEVKAVAEIKKWLRLADVLPSPQRGPSSEYLAERRAEMAAEDYIGGFCE